jgi:RimJ/RimL family protein N-acetyltransferase
LHDARDIAKAQQAFVTVYGFNEPSRHVIEKAGFQHEGSLFKKRRLLWSTRYAVSAGGPFATALL